MKKTTLLLTAICTAMGLASVSPAMAAPVGIAGSISGLYTNLSFSGGGSANTWGGGGSVAFGLGMSDLAGQVDANFSSWSASGGGGSLTQWGVGGSAMWAPAMGRFGATVAYNSLDGSGAGFHTTSYGGFGDFYAGDMFTISAKVGGASFSASGCGSSCIGSNSSGWYFGGAANVYAMPDLSLQGSIDYLGVTGGSETNYGVQAEWLVSESTPLSVGGSYHYITVSGGGSSLHLSQWIVVVKFYFNGDNSMSLKDRQRNGAATWSVVAPQLIGG